MTKPLDYTLWFSKKQHHIHVKLIIANPLPTGQVLCMAAWMPGSYLIRDFARHVIAFSASNPQGAVCVQKTNAHTWQCAPSLGPLEIQYTVYAFERSVRGAYVDDTHIFFDGARVFLAVLGQEQSPTHVCIHTEPSDWRCMTAMPLEHAQQGRHSYRVNSYAELIDHPVACGQEPLFHTLSCHAGGLRHDIHVYGATHYDQNRLKQDVARVCQTVIDFFGGAAPFSHYHFFLDVVASGHGGLEHRSSTAMTTSRDDLPYSYKGDHVAYRSLLSLFLHEYFHVWWVKHVRPRSFAVYTLQEPLYTRLLWVFEGFTAYYDQLLLVRAGLMTVEQYLEQCSFSITRYLQSPGRELQSAAEASWDAWIKFYKPDENTVNSTVSYYNKGALIALCLDLQLRSESEARYSLDDIVRGFWQHYQKTGEGLAEDAVESAVEALGYPALAHTLRDWVYGTHPLPIEESLRLANLIYRRGWACYEWGGSEALKISLDSEVISLGIRLEQKHHDCVIAHVLLGSVAMRSGLCAGDILLAINGWRVTKSSYAAILKRYGVQSAVEISFFREDRLHQITLIIEPSSVPAVWIEQKTGDKPKTAMDQKALLVQEAWLGLSSS